MALLIDSLKRILVLINPKSGIANSFNAIRRAMDVHWERRGAEVIYQFCQSKEDAEAKTRRAVEAGLDAIFVCGGDGTVSSIGRVLMGSNVSMGVIPCGSGNGFGRHFGIPLSPPKAVAALAESIVSTIDVGTVNGVPFLITCSMAWDASIVRSFEKMPVRGFIPYLFAGAYELLDYEPQEMEIELDNGEKHQFPDPVVFTVANLSQYGGGTKIAPHADPADGMLELVVCRHRDMPLLLASAVRFFDGSIAKIPQVFFRSLRKWL